MPVLSYEEWQIIDRFLKNNPMRIGEDVNAYNKRIMEDFRIQQRTIVEKLRKALPA